MRTGLVTGEPPDDPDDPDELLLPGVYVLSEPEPDDELKISRSTEPFR